MDRLAAACALSALLGMAVGASGAEKTPATKLIAAGNDRVLWLAVGQWDSQDRTYVYRFALLDELVTPIRSVSNLAPQRGRIDRWAVAGKRLHVFYGRDAVFRADGAHYSIEWSGTSGRSQQFSEADRERPLPGPVMPAAVAGESAARAPRLWALVTAETAAAVETGWMRDQGGATSRAAEQPDHESLSPPLADSAPTREKSSEAFYHLVQYDGTEWRPGFAATPQCPTSERVWLTLVEDRFYLLWQRRTSDRVIHSAYCEQDRSRSGVPRWIQGPTLSLGQTIVNGTALVINRRLVFEAMVAAGEGTDRLVCRGWLWQPSADGTGGWTPLPALSEPAEVKSEGGERSSKVPESKPGELRLPPGSTVSGSRDQLAVVRPVEQEAEVAFFSPTAGGPPSSAFRRVPLAAANPATAARRGLYDLMATMVVVALLALVFWRRQESLAVPVPLPVGTLVAGPGKRALAAAIDMIPAAVVVAVFWREDLFPHLRQLWAASAAYVAGQHDTLEALVTPDSLVWAWVWFRLLYVGYCIACEIIMQGTPGKKLLSCRLLTEDLGSPNGVQVVIRNITKLIELEPTLQIWPFMLVIFFTRNRQRLGDLLARTIVVDQQYESLEPPEQDREDEG
ncbi:MAG: RDD family protein [Phycisphaerae bacterium]|nr:RDD family protein [Phycisphaerae bacterium]